MIIQQFSEAIPMIIQQFIRQFQWLYSSSGDNTIEYPATQWGNSNDYSAVHDAIQMGTQQLSEAIPMIIQQFSEAIPVNIQQFF